MAVEVMDIGNVLNNKRFQHHMSSNFMQHAPSHFPIIKPEPGMVEVTTGRPVKTGDVPARRDPAR